MQAAVIERLRAHGIHPSPQRVAVAEVILHTDRHPSADEVWAKARRKLPALSRATVYNTLKLLVDKGLLRQLVLAEGKTVYDPKVEAHHHVIDEASGRIYDVPWHALRVSDVNRLREFEVTDYQVVMRGRRRST